MSHIKVCILLVFLRIFISICFKPGFYWQLKGFLRIATCKLSVRMRQFVLSCIV